MTVIGVADEPKGRIQRVVKNEEIEYIVALRSGSAFNSRAYPTAWLVSPKGKVVWKGHPASLDGKKIEKFLKGARFEPKFSLPRKLKAASRYLGKRDCARAIRELEKHVAGKDEAVARVAKDTIRELKRYAKREYKFAGRFAKSGEYADAVAILEFLEKSFKGFEAGERAKVKLKAWRDDKKIKLEIEASSQIAKARTLISRRQYAPAYKVLQNVARRKKYKDTRAKEIAVKLAKEIRRYV